MRGVKCAPLGNRNTRVLLGVLAIEERGEYPSARAVAAQAGFAVSATHKALVALHAEGLVCYPPDKQGCTHALVTAERVL